MSNVPITDRTFPPTAWTVLLTARKPDAAETREARETLCKVYWRPVASYLQALGLTHEQAEDGAQETMSALCSDGALAEINPANGRLRHFLKAAARNLVLNFRRNESTQKRGAGVATLSLDELPDGAIPCGDAPTDAVFDREWACAIFARAMSSLEESYALRGKGALLAALKPALISADGLQPYDAIGSSLGVGESQIKLEVHRLRRRFAERLRAEVAATLAPDANAAEIEEEARYLVQTLAHEPAV